MGRGYRINSDVDEAQGLAAALVKSQGSRTRDTAIAHAASAVGLSRWSLWTLYYGRRKTVASGTLRALRDAYRRLLERQASHLVAEMDDLKQRCGDDDEAIIVLGDAVQRLVDELRQRRETST